MNRILLNQSTWIFFKDIQLPKLNEDILEELNKPFTMQEIQEVIKQLKNDKVPGPDGLPVEFY